MKNSFRLSRELPVLLLLIIPFVTLPFVWERLPDLVPIHWDMNGEPDRMAEKTTGLLLIPCISVGLYLLFWLIPVIDPKRKVTMQKKPLPALRFLLILLLTLLFFITIGVMMGVDGVFGLGHPIPLGVILVFLAIGNYLPALQPNYFIGIRTPWTLQDADIWRKTHRLGGRLWVIGSLVLFVAWALLPQPVFSKVFLAVVLIVMALIPVLYSLALFLRKKQRPIGSE
jgi:uncharacterized membrane protein